MNSNLHTECILKKKALASSDYHQMEYFVLTLLKFSLLGLFVPNLASHSGTVISIERCSDIPPSKSSNDTLIFAHVVSITHWVVVCFPGDYSFCSDICVIYNRFIATEMPISRKCTRKIGIAMSHIGPRAMENWQTWFRYLFIRYVGLRLTCSLFVGREETTFPTRSIFSSTLRQTHWK